MKSGHGLGIWQPRIGRAWWPSALLLSAAVTAATPDDFTYTVSFPEGTITITGYTGPGGAVAIPSGMDGRTVTRIRSSAFYSRASVTSVTIPNTIISIGFDAFRGCTSLARVTIGSGVAHIESGVFDECSSLTAITVSAANPWYSSLDGVLFDKSPTELMRYPPGRSGAYTIPNSVTSIEGGAFEGCAKLTRITIPSSVTSIWSNAFAGCTELTSVTIPNSVTFIWDDAFAGCTGLTSVTIPNSVTSIGLGAFSECSSLASAKIGTGVASIEESMFSGCTSLTSLTIPNNVTSIGRWALASCTSLTRISVPSSVTSIEDSAFEGCTDLAGVYFGGNAPYVGEGVFAGASGATVYYLGGTTGWHATLGGCPTELLTGPAITGLSPTYGTPAGGTLVVITGTDLTGATAVRFGAAAASFVVNSATQIKATAPAGKAGQTVDVSIITPVATSASTDVDDYTYADGIAPTLTLTSSAAEATDLTPIPVLATFSRPVTGFDALDLIVTNGTVGALAGSGATYSFVVTPAGQGRVTVAVAAGVCISKAGTLNSAAVPLSRTYDSLRPIVVDVFSPTRDGIYGPGAVIAITTAFSEPVSVDGAPQLTLETGAADAAATYTSGTGASILTFLYTVVAGHCSPDLDYTGTSALALNGGTITDAAGNAAVMTLPAPGAPYSLGVNNALVVAAVGAPSGPFLARVEAPEVALSRGLWDLTGSYSTSAKGNPLALNLLHDPTGRLSGTATCTVAPDTTVTMPIRGSVKGCSGSITVKGTLKGANSAKLVDVLLTLNLTVDTANRQLVGRLTGTIRENGITTPVNEDITLAIVSGMNGTWTLRCQLEQAGRRLRGSALLTLSNGVEHAFVVQGRPRGANAVLSLAGDRTEPTSKAINIKTTINTLEGEGASIECFSGNGYGQAIGW